jgi:hypothetical protein
MPDYSQGMDRCLPPRLEPVGRPLAPLPIKWGFIHRMGIAHVTGEVNDKFILDKTRLLILNDSLAPPGGVSEPFF